jgi:hypothetical protein
MKDRHDEWEDSLLVHLMKWAKKETNEDGCEEWEDSLLVHLMKWAKKETNEDGCEELEDLLALPMEARILCSDSL